MRKKGILSAVLAAGLLIVLYAVNPFARQAASSEPATTDTMSVREHHLAVSRDGANCALCHDTQEPSSPADDEKCLACHGGYERVAHRTAHLENNPHNSPHYGITAACTACHNEHRPSEAICSSCHLFTYENLK